MFGVAGFWSNATRDTIFYRLLVGNIRNVVAAHIHLGPRGETGVFTSAPGVQFVDKAAGLSKPTQLIGSYTVGFTDGAGKPAYGVGPGKWFTWFYHDPTKAKKIPFDTSRLDMQTAASAAARTSGATTSSRNPASRAASGPKNSDVSRARENAAGARRQRVISMPNSGASSMRMASSSVPMPRPCSPSAVMNATSAEGDPSAGRIHRPTGLAQGTDGSIYVADDVAGTIYKISYKGTK